MDDYYSSIEKNFHLFNCSSSSLAQLLYLYLIAVRAIVLFRSSCLTEFLDTLDDIAHRILFSNVSRKPGSRLFYLNAREIERTREKRRDGDIIVI